MAPTTKAAARATKAPATNAKKKAVAKKATAKKAPAKKTTSKKAPAKKTTAKKAPAKKAPVRATATNTTAKKATTKKASTATASVKRATKKTTAKKPATKAPGKKAASRAAATSAPATPSARRGTIPALAKRVPTDSDRKAPPKRTGPLDKFLLDQLADLQEERITYTRQAASLKAEADLLVAEREPGDVQFDEESGEGDTLAVERERDLALSASAQNAVEDIDRAIAKIHDGTYGICEQCYAKIPKERLRALPYAALCVQCKSAGFSRR